MAAQAQLWMPAVLALFGTLIVVVFTAWLNSRMLAAKVDAQGTRIDALRAEMKQSMAELELRLSKQIMETKQSIADFEVRLSKQIMELGQRIDRLEEDRGLVRP